MLRTGDLVTLHVNGVRYLEKPPLPYWIAALSLRLFAHNPTQFDKFAAFAIHLPLALTVLALALLGYAWSRRAFGPLAALYTAIFTLTSAGVFLFTRVFIPDALLSLLLATALYALLRALESPPHQPSNWGSPGRDSRTRIGNPLAPATYAYLMWLALALAVLTKGLVAIVFFFGTGLIFLTLTGERNNLKRLRPVGGLALFLAAAAPWHILAGLRNTAAANGHGFFWFYFVNEHFLRFLGRRIPADYNKLPAALYWSLHLVWLFPWSLFAPAALIAGWRKRRHLQSQRDLDAEGEPLSRFELVGRRRVPRAPTFAARTVLLLTIFSSLVLLFFSFSTNQEYYTFPAYLPLLMLLAAALAATTSTASQTLDPGSSLHRALTFAYATLTLLGFSIATTLAIGLYSSRNLPFVSDIGSVLAHRGIGNYTLSLSSFFDLTGPSFAALRLPATLAAIAFTVGPTAAWLLYKTQKPVASFLAVGATSTAFLLAAHIALGRFAPMLSSRDFADTIQHLQSSGEVAPNTQILLFGDQAYGSSISFYLNHQVLLVDGRSTSMLFGSTFPDTPPVFLTHDQLLAQWGTGPRKILFVPVEYREQVDHLLTVRKILLAEASGKALFTDRPLNLR
jgi:4-amino-4-deoxy-L-arabinose transferase-like glycosyltransferase